MKREYKSLESSLYDECAKQLVAAFKEAPWNEDWTYEEAYTRIDEIMCSRVSRGYVICEDNHVVAMACGRIMTYQSNKEFWIDELSVHPHVQSGGLGSSLLNFIKNEVTKEGITHICLNTTKGFPCVDFYKKNEFKTQENNEFMYCVLNGGK